MIEKLHEHINLELNVNTRTDTIFVITAVIFNFVMLGVSSGFASEASGEYGSAESHVTAQIILAITLVLSVLVNIVAVVGLITGRATRQKLTAGLLKMYEDSKINQYYDATLLTNYNRRYVMFIAIIALLGLTSIAIPLVILLT